MRLRIEFVALLLATLFFIAWSIQTVWRYLTGG